MTKDEQGQGDRWARSIGNRIARGRRAARLTQLELAEKVGVTRVAVSAIENGRFGISIPTLLEMAIVLRREPSSLLPALSELTGCEPEDAAQVINRYYGDATNEQKNADQEQGGTGGK